MPRPGTSRASGRSWRACASAWTRGDLLGASDQNAVLHGRILDISGHATAGRLIATLKSQLVRFQYRTILLPGRSERSFGEHSAIVDAIAGGDPDAAERAMRTHLSHVAEALRGDERDRRAAVGARPRAAARRLRHPRARRARRGRAQVDDVTLARRFPELGMAGFVLKSHYGSTAERASVVRGGRAGGATCSGAITLNRAVGGINPLAVEIAAREGARTVWFPTVDSVNESHERDGAGRGEGAGVGEAPARAARGRGSRSSRSRSSTPTAPLLPEVAEVLAMIARHEMVLATGHLRRDEIFAVVDAALEAGVERSSSPTPSSPPRT